MLPRVPSSSGALPIGPSFPENGHTIAAGAPELASQRPLALHDIDLTLAGYPLIRMCLPSDNFQPCSAFSCMVVTTKSPSGENVMPVCAPSHCNSWGLPSVAGKCSVAPL